MSNIVSVPVDIALDNALWQFAGKLWSRTEAQQACLALQTEGWSVTRLLCALWLAHVEKVYSGIDDVEVTQWRRNVTNVLRQTRMAIAKGNPSTENCRNSIARSELEAEKVELALAYRALAPCLNQPAGHSQKSRNALAWDNLLAAAPETDMSNETSQQLDTLIRELSLLARDRGVSCS